MAKNNLAKSTEPSENKSKKSKSEKTSFSILTKLTTLFLIIFIFPMGFLLYLGYMTNEGLTTIKTGTENTAKTTDESYNKTVTNIEGATKLQAVEKIYSLAGHIELIFESKADELEDPDDISTDPTLLKIIRSRKIGAAGYVCIVDPKNDNIVLHRTVDSDELISEELPNLWKMIEKEEYLKLLADLERTEERKSKGLGGVGLANRRLSRTHVFEIKNKKGGIDKEFWIITPLAGTPYSLAGTTSLASLVQTILAEVSTALDAVNKNVSIVEKKSETIKKSYQKNLIIISIIGLIVLVLIYIYIRGSFINPIRYLTKTAEKIKEGNLEIRTNVKTRDELQIFGESFNSMLDRISKQIETLGEIESASKNISSSMNHSKMLQFGIDSIRDLVTTTTSVIYLLDKEKNILKSAAISGDEKFHVTKLDLDQGFLSTILSECKTFSVDDLENDTTISSLDKGIFKCKSLLCVPIQDKAEVVGLIVLTEHDKIHSFSQEETYTVETLSTSISIQLKNIGLLAEVADKARMDQELKTAQAVQTALFPDKSPDFDRLDIHGFFKSASETGGDWYGFITEKSKYQFILIGDVTGHGTPAALVVAAVRGACIAIEENIKELDIHMTSADILKKLNKVVYMTGVNKWVMTFFIGCFNQETSEFVYANAGHNMPMIAKMDEKKGKVKVSSLTATGYRLGYDPDSTFEMQTTTFNKGDLILFYTDGLIECTNPQRQEYGKRNVRKQLAKLYYGNSETARNEIRDEAFKFFDNFPMDDDVTFLTAKVI